MLNPAVLDPKAEHNLPADLGPNPVAVTSLLLLFCAALFAITLTGYPQFMDNEWRLSAYVLDVLQNGRWFCPTDANGDVVSKPPMLTWLAALGAWLTGSVNAFSLYWPTAFATALTAAVLFTEGRKHFGWRTGLLAAAAYLISYVGLSQMSMPRYDGLLALPVTLAAFAAFSAWQTGRGWTWFFFFGALGTLVKGPIALLLPAFGLLAHVWEKRTFKTETLSIRGSPVAGIALFLLIAGGWFVLAWLEMGQPLIDKMLGRELVRHAVQGAPLLSGVHEPTKFFMGIYAPWSLVALAAFWRLVRHPDADPHRRRLERFLFCWFIAGLVLFSVASHQRGRLMYPLIPAAAFLAGTQLNRWTARLSARQLVVTIILVALAFLAGAGVYTHVLIGKSRRVQETLAMRDLSRELRRLDSGQFPLTHMRSPMSLQVWLNTRRAEVTPAQAAVLLTNSAAAFVVTKDLAALRTAVPSNSPFNEVFRWPAQGSAKVWIVSNHPRFERPPHVALWMDNILLRLEGASLLGTRGQQYIFAADSARATIYMANHSSVTNNVVLQLVRDGHRSAIPATLGPGASIEKSW